MSTPSKTSHRRGANSHKALVQAVASDIVLSRDRMLDAAARAVAQKFGATLGIISSVKSRKHSAQSEGLFDSRGRFQSLQYKLDGTPCADVYDTKAPVICNGTAQAAYPEDLDLKALDVRTYVGVPLIGLQGNVEGVFCVLSEDVLPGAEDGAVARVIEALSPRIAADLENRKMMGRFDRATDVAASGLWSMDMLAGRVTYSDMAMRIIGTEAREQTSSVSKLFPWLDDQANAQIESALFSHIEVGSRLDLSVQMRPDSSGQKRWLQLVGAVTVRDNGMPTEISGSIVDVTHFIEERQHAVWMASQLESARMAAEQDALHDALTGLPNRRHLDVKLAQTIAHAGKEDKISLLHIDLDRFKEINDTHGHAAGDCVLTEVSTRLRKALRKSDLVARIGGDEFVVLCDNDDPAGLQKLGEKIVSACAKPVEYAGHACQFGASVGIATVPATEARDAIHKADAALYEAKEAGRGRVAFYSEESLKAQARAQQAKAATTNAA